MWRMDGLVATEQLIAHFPLAAEINSARRQLAFQIRSRTRIGIYPTRPQLQLFALINFLLCRKITASLIYSPNFFDFAFRIKNLNARKTHSKFLFAKLALRLGDWLHLRG